MCEIEATIDSYRSAIEHCRAASESDPGWFTLDVQDSYSRRVAIMRDAANALETSPMPLPEEARAIDSVKGKMFAGYSRTAEVLSRGTAGLQENPGIASK